MFVFTKRGSGKASTAAIVLVALYARSAGALQFGALSVRSHLNQPLDATLQVTHLSATDRADLNVGIAPPDMFKRFGIRRSSAVDRIRIDTRYDKRGDRAFVHLSTQRPIKEPFVDFLLQAEAGNASALREYTAMLDPAGTTPAAPAATAQAQATPSRTRAERRAVSAASTSARRGRGGSGSHTVRAGESLWSIAAANTPDGASVAQAMSAIYSANRAAFGGNMSTLLRGARLDMPPASAIRSVNATRAKQRLANAPSPGSDASADAPDSNGRRLAASGQMPRDRPKTDSADVATGKPSASPGPGAPNNVADSDAAAATSTRFGRLSLPSATPWPASGAAPANASSAGSATNSSGEDAKAVAAAYSDAEANADANTNTRSNPDQTSQTVSGSSNNADANANANSDADGSDGAGTASADSGAAIGFGETAQAASDPAASNPAASDSAASEPASSDNGPPPVDVAKTDNASLASPRNLLLLATLVIVLALGFRRVWERRYKTISLETLPDEAAADTEMNAEIDERDTALTAASVEPTPRGSSPTRAPAGDEVAAVAASAGRSAYDHRSTSWPEVEEPETPYGEASAPVSAEPAAASRHHADPPRAEHRPAAESADVDQFEPPFRPATPGASADASAGATAEDSAARDLGSGDPEGGDAQADSGAEQTPLSPESPGLDEDETGLRVETDEQTEALAFESAPLPEQSERRHDLGGDNQNGLSFATDASPAQPDREVKAPDAEAPETNPYRLEMIDPGDVGLDDPSSELTAEPGDETADSLEMRLDLARMYVDMDDYAAARDLLDDVRERGSADQQRAAVELQEQF